MHNTGDRPRLQGQGTSKRMSPRIRCAQPVWSAKDLEMVPGRPRAGWLGAKGPSHSKPTRKADAVQCSLLQVCIKVRAHGLCQGQDVWLYSWLEPGKPSSWGPPRAQDVQAHKPAGAPVQLGFSAMQPDTEGQGKQAALRLYGGSTTCVTRTYNSSPPAPLPKSQEKSHTSYCRQAPLATSWHCPSCCHSLRSTPGTRLSFRLVASALTQSLAIDPRAPSPPG